MPQTGQTAPIRPDGALIWGHATRAEHVYPMRQLAERLRSQQPECTLLLTQAEEASAEADFEDQTVIPTRLPADNAASTDAFLDVWKPDFALWTAGRLGAAFVERTTGRNIPFGLVDAEADLVTGSAWHWLTGVSRSTLGKLAFIFTRDRAALRYVESLKLPGVELALGGPFVESGMSLPYSEADRAEMAGLLLGRPIWLAAYVTAREVPVILEAHRSVMRFSHRALLILAPDQTVRLDSFMKQLDISALRTIRWSDGATPDETTQVLVADVAGELGLWYRLAPISFLGNSLFRGQDGKDPNEPAAHGSAVLHGPYLGRRAVSFQRFTEAAAARQVRDADALASAVTRLIQPDQCASMAHKAWEVASRGSALTDRIADRILDHIEQAGRQG